MEIIPITFSFGVNSEIITGYRDIYKTSSGWIDPYDTWLIAACHEIQNKERYKVQTDENQC